MAERFKDQGGDFHSGKETELNECEFYYFYLFCVSIQLFMCRSMDRRSKLISAPTNFNHISHMGPGEGIQRQRLIDLTTSLVDSADPNAGGYPLSQSKVIYFMFRYTVRELEEFVTFLSFFFLAMQKITNQ